MGLGGISIWQLLIILVIVLLLFGTKRLRGLGGDLGGAIKGFKKAMSDEEIKAEEARRVTEDDKSTDTTQDTGNPLNQKTESQKTESQTTASQTTESQKTENRQ